MEFKIIVIDILKALVEKVKSMHEHFNKEKLRKNQMKMRGKIRTRTATPE